MSFRLRHEQHPNAFGKDPTCWIVEDDAGNRLDVWPALGFNAFRWTAAGVDLLDTDPAFFQVQKPTRSGFPILFPFPNRIREGQFTWKGRGYQLPLNCPVGRNAIHGFTTGAVWSPSVSLTAEHATLTGRFEFSGNQPLWPASGTLIVDYRLFPNALEVNARVESASETLPFGLGYHPHFAVAPFGGDDAIVTLAADSIWELHDLLPTGVRKPPEPSKDLRDGQQFGNVSFDDAFTDLKPRHSANGLGWIGGIKHPTLSRKLDYYVGPQFRDVVVFTSPHRRDICLEPYTCMTDAINLQAKGIDTGWLELPPHSVWLANSRLEFTP